MDRQRITPAFVFVQCHLVESGQVMPPSVLTFMVIWLRPFVVFGLEKISRSFPRDVVFSVHVDEACHTNRFLQGTAAGRMFIPGLAQIAGGGHGAVASPVVTHVQHQDTRFDLGYLRLGRVRTCQVMQMPGGSPVFAVHDTGVRYTGGVDELDRETNVPSFIVIPRPGPCNRKYQEGSFTCGVMLIGWLQVLPSSSLLTSISWAVLSADIPGMEFHQARPFPMPCVQAATIRIVFVFSSTRIDGSPTPFCA